MSGRTGELGGRARLVVCLTFELILMLVVFGRDIGTGLSVYQSVTYSGFTRTQ